MPKILANDKIKTNKYEVKCGKYCRFPQHKSFEELSVLQVKPGRERMRNSGNQNR
jgi:hypothetical protein